MRRDSNRSERVEGPLWARSVSRGTGERVLRVGPRGTVQDRSAAERVTALAPSGNAFVELPQFGMGLGGGMMTLPLGEVQHGASRCRLTVESAAGSLTVVTASGEGENELVEAVCRFVLGALEGSSRA